MERYLRCGRCSPGRSPGWPDRIVDRRDSGNRYNGPETGRFTQQDPIGVAGGANVYGFAGGDPVNFVDPFGLCKKGIDKESKYKECVEISLEEGRQIAAAALARMKSHQDGGVTYAQARPMPAGNDDCSNFCDMVVQSAGFDVPATSTSEYASSLYFARIHPRRARAGDILWQRGPGHVGIFSGKYDANGRPLGYQMGVSGAKLGPWGPGGWFRNGSSLTFYRLLKPKEDN